MKNKIRSIVDKFKVFVGGDAVALGKYSVSRKTLVYVLCALVAMAVLLSTIMIIRGFSKEAEITPAAVTETPETERYQTDTPKPTATPNTTESTETEENSDAPTETEAATATHTPEAEPTEEAEVEAEHTGFINIMTGEPLDEITAKRRPVAYVINNLKKALPQSGIGQASMYYEVLAEADITRIIAVFQDFDAGKIGSIRSARDYFFYFAYDNDALFAHHGASTGAYKVIRAGKIDNFDGQDLEGVMFWRDPVRYNTPGMGVHSSYTNMANTFKQVEKYNYRLNKNDNFEGMFKFYESPSTPEGGIPCYDITVPYISSMKARFVYVPETNKYLKYQNGSAHIDAETGEQLSVTNVIIQQTVMYVIANDPEGRRAVELISSGRGYLATNGAYVPLTWKKTSSASPTQWFFEDGTPLTLNVGKTWVSVLASDIEPVFED